MFASIFNASAQYITNNCNTIPAYGDSLTGTTIQYDTTGVTPGVAGANITWNYATLTVDTTSVLSHYYFDPATTPGASNFPSANLADLTPVGVYSYYQYSPDSVIYLGNYVASVNCEIAWDPQKSLICPFAYGNSFSDNFTRYRCGSGAYSHTYSTRQTTYDGYGTLILPSTTFNNVVRIKIEDTTIDSTFLSNNSFLSTTTTIGTTYMWVDVNTSQAVFMCLYYNIITYNYSYKLIAAPTYSHIPDVVTSVQPAFAEEQSVVSIYPNPCNTSTTIEINDNFRNKNYDFILYDVLGREIKNYKIINHKSKIERGDLPGGMYFYKVNGKDETIGTGKLLIE